MVAYEKEKTAGAMPWVHDSGACCGNCDNRRAGSGAGSNACRGGDRFQDILRKPDRKADKGQGRRVHDKNGHPERYAY